MEIKYANFYLVKINNKEIFPTRHMHEIWSRDEIQRGKDLYKMNESTCHANLSHGITWYYHPVVCFNCGYKDSLAHNGCHQTFCGIYKATNLVQVSNSDFDHSFIYIYPVAV